MKIKVLQILFAPALFTTATSIDPADQEIHLGGYPLFLFREPATDVAHLNEPGE